ncbi:DUF2189 domain-containing protein [Cyclobacterium amurskyense]|jgi:uncharacterized membrane protein|uniref:Uncharacterized protein n=1 Tax=Cyclobacterium amurskyense TaxID=320787 RepID=A0A0H4PGJ3_9BACT|nr:membrane protein [Cyclobacterium amurskyense]AKP52165.1 hypothetical protein CA2015_2755 [Cyclobacterium amurskyense]|tara:strand:- start:8914 stop:9549 length:636 start_codon:yes stop_codon:yes gene_type:complete
MDKKHLDRIVEGNFDFDIVEALKEGWETYRKVTIYSISFTLLILSLQFLFMYYAEDYIFVFSFFLAGPLFAGFYLVANKVSLNETVIYPDFFKGFRYYLPVVLVWIVGQVITVLGVFALILPGIYLMVAYMFGVLITLFSGLDFWQSLEYSRKIIHKKWGKFFVFGLALALMNLIGALAFGVGLVITIPVTYYAIYHVFEGLSQGLPIEEE